jgi:hypothetical protein
MKLEEVHFWWAEDSKIDVTELGTCSANIQQLHARYLRFFSDEKLRLRKLETELKKLKLEKYEFYSTGETKESRDRGWTFPARGVPLKADLPMYTDADPQIVEMNLRIGYQQEVVDVLESIVKQINWRNAIIRNIIDDIRWKSGG